MGDPKKDKSEALLEALGSFVNRLGGRYGIAEDIVVINRNFVLHQNLKEDARKW